MEVQRPPPPQLQQQQQSQQQLPQQQQPVYTLPGVLHYLQIEWRRFERERNEWELERSDLNAKLSFLENERRGLENLKTDLARRVRMLEGKLLAQQQQIQQQQPSIAGTTSPPPTSSSPAATALQQPPLGPAQSVSPDVVPLSPSNNNQPSRTAGANDEFDAKSGSAAGVNSRGPPLQTGNNPGALLEYSKGIGNLRTREILKNYLREANYLLAHSGISTVTSPKIGTTYSQLPTNPSSQPSVDSDPASTTATHSSAPYSEPPTSQPPVTTKKTPAGIEPTGPPHMQSASPPPEPDQQTPTGTDTPQAPNLRDARKTRRVVPEPAPPLKPALEAPEGKLGGAAHQGGHEAMAEIEAGRSARASLP
ncbi:hypothetical protein HK405_009022, partial [Cladochytrium tenue]